MEEISQIRIGKHMTGIIGLKAALQEATVLCRDLTDEQLGTFLIERLSKHNYIEAGAKHLYQEAFVREYKRIRGEPVPEPAASGLEIKVLGMGCPQCELLVQEVMAALTETGIAAELEHVRDAIEISRYRLLGMPALMINKSVVWTGSVPPRSKIAAWITQAVRQTTTELRARRDK